MGRLRPENIRHAEAYLRGAQARTVTVFLISLYLLIGIVWMSSLLLITFQSKHSLPISNSAYASIRMKVGRTDGYRK